MNSKKPGSGAKIRRVRSLADDRQRSAKTIIITLIVIIAGITILSVALLGIVSQYNKPQENKDGSFLFYEPDYEFDIMEDPAYLALDREVRFRNPETGITVSVDHDSMDEVPNIQRKAVGLLLNFIDYAIEGKSEALNSLFSDEYIEADGKLKMDFTMQQLYNISIEYVQTTSEVVEGNTYVSHDYWLEYMIRKNNGTFRNDMESDCIRKEYVRVTERVENLGIDILAPYKTEAMLPQPLEGSKIAVMTVVSAILITAVAAGVVIIVKASKNKK